MGVALAWPMSTGANLAALLNTEVLPNKGDTDYGGHKTEGVDCQRTIASIYLAKSCSKSKEAVSRSRMPSIVSEVYEPRDSQDKCRNRNRTTLLTVPIRGVVSTTKMEMLRHTQRVLSEVGACRPQCGWRLCAWAAAQVCSRGPSPAYNSHRCVKMATIFAGRSQTEAGEPPLGRHEAE